MRRALRDPTHGFYVDVGAAHPVRNSVTRYFYDRGWSGINIEPEPRFFAALVAARPRDVNLQLAVASEPGETELLVVGVEAELSTLDPSVAETYFGDLETSRVTVATEPLEAILEQYASGPIDLLKIDVEGRETDALASFDLEAWAPRVLVVEATWPGTTEPSHHGWEPGVLEAGYELGLFDGLNRFYARTTDEQTLTALRVPANIFDNFIQYRWWELLSTEARAKLAADGFPNPAT